MRRGSDTNIDIAAPDLEEDIVEKVFISLSQLGMYMAKEATISEGIAHVELKADETMKFAPGPIFLQIYAHTKDKKVIQSDIIRYKVADTLMGGDPDVKSHNGFHVTVK